MFATPGEARQSLPDFNLSPEIIGLVALMCVCFRLSFRNLEYLLFERGIDISQMARLTLASELNAVGPLSTQ